MIKLCPPVREAKYFGWQHVLKDLNDLNRCTSQHFGENDLDYSQFGLEGHNGIDITFNENTEVIASHDGEVLYIEKDVNTGYGVVLWNKEHKYKTIYWHFNAWLVEQGEQVQAGQPIGLGDSTGWSTGHHLHWGLKRTDTKGNTTNYNNGYKGAIDPIPFLHWFEDRNMTKEEVELLYVLAFNRQPDKGELGFWTGQQLEEFLRTAIEDRSDFLGRYS